MNQQTPPSVSHCHDYRLTCGTPRQGPTAPKGLDACSQRSLVPKVQGFPSLFFLLPPLPLGPALLPCKNLTRLPLSPISGIPPLFLKPPSLSAPLSIPAPAPTSRRSGLASSAGHRHFKSLSRPLPTSCALVFSHQL